ncbi:MAG: LamG domain-containing protein, partial [Verrucomicrobiaceae bacterium]
TFDKNAGGAARLYVDGALKASFTANFTPATKGDFYIGSYPGSAYFKGQLDEVSLYTRALSPGEIYSIFAAGAVGKCPVDNNEAPAVNAGADKSAFSANESVALEGAVADDGLPAGSVLQVQWRKVDGPGEVQFADANEVDTLAQFSAEGIYLLELSADDGAQRASDLVEVRVGVSCSLNAPEGLAAWWPANGTSVEMLSGRASDLTGANFVPGQVSQAWNFDGADDQIITSQTSALDIGVQGAMTVEYWMNIGLGTPSATFMGWKSAASSAQGVQFYLSGSYLYVYLYDALSGNYGYTYIPRPAVGTWHHVALTFDKNAGGAARLYVDGALKASFTANFTPATKG